jgi:hypothetical protein
LPRFIRIEQEVAYISPGESRTSTIISEGTTFEVKRVSIFKKFRYIKCKSVKTSKLYYFKEDFPINCTAVEDPDDHTFLNIAGKFIPLPKTAQFQNVWADDVVIKDDDEASTMLILTGGPFKILKAFVRRTLYVVRTKTEVSDEQNVGLIPNNIWNKQLVKLKKFQSRADKQEYIIKHFGENFDSSFIISGLYTMSQLETGIIWLKAPFQNKEGRHCFVLYTFHRHFRMYTTEQNKILYIKDLIAKHRLTYFYHCVVNVYYNSMIFKVDLIKIIFVRLEGS